MNIVLCGMMGCGKTTVARALSGMYSLGLVDTDEEIVKRYGVISEIFATRGEEYFRDIESGITEELAASCKNTVISVGGGCVLREKNVTALKRSGKIIYMRATAETLIERLRGDDTRPLLKGDMEAQLRTRLKERAPVYERVADAAVDVDGLSPVEIAEIIGGML